MSENYADTIAALAVRAEGAEILNGKDGRQWLVIPGQPPRDISDREHEILEPPTRVCQIITLQTATSLADYVERFKDTAATVLFADIDRNFIQARIDYHVPHGEAAHLLHTADLSLPLSYEWRQWHAMQAKGLVSQLDMARFLDENRGDIASPDAATVLEATRSLQAIRKVNFTKAVRLDSENECFTYTDETNLTRENKVEVPTEFSLRLPVYFGGQMVTLQARLIWKLQDGQLFLGIKLLRSEQVRQAEFKMVVDDVASKTGCEAFFGRTGG